MNPIVIDNETYFMDKNECKSIVHNEYNNLKLYEDLDMLYKLVDIILDMSNTLNLSLEFLDKEFELNYGSYVYKNITQQTLFNSKKLLFVMGANTEYKDNDEYDVIFSVQNLEIPNMEKILLSGITWKKQKIFVYIKNIFLNTFLSKFHWYINQEQKVFEYKNMINLVIMVKDAGDGFRDVLLQNLPYIDRWTILDTGSTDNTISIIEEVLVPRKRGELFREDFVDFGTTRNRALELANKSCRYNIMLDDTYILKGDLRGFLEEIYSDQFADSYSLFISSNDVQYASNRVLKSNRNLKYIFKIHEVIQEENNKNVIVPLERAKILDIQSPYMEQRTINRKEKDLQLLYDSVKEDPDNPRYLYYIAQTYVGMKNYEMAYKFHLQRLYHNACGFLQEKVDSCFEAARIGQYQLSKPWEDIKYLYLKAFELDPTRPEPMYFLGIKDLMDKNRKEAYDYFKKAFDIGYPIHAQYSLKPSLSFHYLPRLLMDLCYEFEDYDLGERASKLYMENNDFDMLMYSWFSIYQLLNKMPKIEKEINIPEKQIICFLIDGNWNPWTGKDIEFRGLGGSETFVVEMARNMKKLNEKLDIYVFCKCSREEEYEGVHYVDIKKYLNFVQENLVHTCIINRYSEYIPVTYKTNVENVYLVVHDTEPTGNIIISHPKLKNIILLTEWHKQHFDEMFPMFNHLTTSFHYGIYQKPYNIESKPKTYLSKFIYSSFANRGLLHILRVWQKIRDVIPEATLTIYSDINHDWVLKNYPREMAEIKKILEKLQAKPNQSGIIYRGWVNKNELSRGWSNADIWLYPCVFSETFCHTALEAAVSKTLVISNHLAALKNTVGDRGLILKQNIHSQKWEDELIDILKNINQPSYYFETVLPLVEKNYKWACEHIWENRAQEFLDKYIYPNVLEYRNMYNWTSDIPVGSKNIMEQIVIDEMKGFSHPKILEIGSWSGTSIIGFLSLLPRGTATVVDIWDNYDEFSGISKQNILASFLRNIKTKNLEDKITFYKNKSSVALTNFIQDREYYHLIYVDGSHENLNCYTDMVLSWSLLIQNGLMIVDDYPLVSIAIEKFLEDYKKSYKLIYKDLRVYIKKLTI